jgi:hypothetical protein
MQTSTGDLKSCKMQSFMGIQLEISFENQMDNMSRDKVEHYYLLAVAFLMLGMSSSSLNIWNATGNPHKKDPMAAKHTASWYQNHKFMQYQICKKGPYKNLGLTARFVLCLSVAFGFFFFPFVTPSCACSPKALHDQQYQLETLRD